MQYRVKHQFQDFVLQLTLDNGYAQAFVVSDDIAPTTATLDLSIFRLENLNGSSCPEASAPTPVWTARIAVPVPALNAALVFNASVSELMRAAPGCTTSSCFLRASAVSSPTKFKPAQSSGADLFLLQFKDLQVARPGVAISDFRQEAPHTVSFEVSVGSAAALLVVLETDLRGHFDTNMINIPPCGSARVAFVADKGAQITPDQLNATLTAATLWENQLEDGVAASEVAGYEAGAGVKAESTVGSKEEGKAESKAEKVEGRADSKAEGKAANKSDNKADGKQEEKESQADGKVEVKMESKSGKKQEAARGDEEGAKWEEKPKSVKDGKQEVKEKVKVKGAEEGSEEEEGQQEVKREEKPKVVKEGGNDGKEGVKEAAAAPSESAPKNETRNNVKSEAKPKSEGKPETKDEALSKSEGEHKSEAKPSAEDEAEQ